jgi:Glycosyl transferases group 1
MPEIPTPPATPASLSAKPLAAAAQTAVVRLAWLFGDRDELMLLRRPLLAEAVRRRHRVLALAPGLTPADQVLLEQAGIESRTLTPLGEGYSFFGAIAARRRLALTLLGWRTNAVVIEDGDQIAFATRAALQACIPSIYPILPSLEGSTRPKSHVSSRPRPAKSWRPALRSATAVFLATPNDARLLSEPLGELGVPHHLLPLACQDLGAISAQQLPPLDAGFVFLGLGDTQSTDNTFARAASAFDSRGTRVRFQLAAPTSIGIAPLPGRHLEALALDGDIATAMRARVTSAHCIVVDDVGPAHTLLLTMALAIGRPVLVVDHAAYRDLVDAGANGWLVPPTDATALAERMAALLKRPDLLPGMARAARQKAERRLDRRTAARVLFGTLGMGDLRAAAA